ncbi:MAG: glycosyltransferase family 10 [Roseovarius sp.]|nr:glycosyltransferase family 10 [Roseovarius sp.]
MSSKTGPRAAILPHHLKLGLRPGAIPLASLIWPLGDPGDIAGKCLRDLRPEDHLILFPRDTLHLRPGFGTRARVSVMVLEPEAIHGAHMRWLRRTHRRFHRVLTCNEALLAAIPNGVFFPFGGTWVPEWRELDLTKRATCSLIASAKRSQEGHELRHAMAEWARAEAPAVDVMGRGYRPFGAKAEGLAPYRYSLVIENVRERNYFTEKLVDAILCQCVPIYWGCPNIGDFLDPDAMVICDNAAQMRAAVRAASADDYAARQPALAAMQARADHWGDFYGRAARAVLDADQDSGGQMP